MAQEKDSRHNCDTVIIFHHGSDASVAQRWRLSAPGECREFRESLLGFVVAWWKLAGRGQL